MKLGGFTPLGVAGGLMSSTMGVVGPVVAPFFLVFGLIKGAYIGTEAMTAVVMHITKLGVYGSYALVGLKTLFVGSAIGVVMFFGTYIGKRILDRVPERIFPYVIEVTLLVSGIIFIARG
jgi:uncharacterized membrane protein YfcA